MPVQRTRSRTRSAYSEKAAGDSDCGPSHRACSGFGCISTSTPSAPAAMPASDSGSTRSGTPGRVARVDDHRQVAGQLHDRHGAHVERVAGGRLEGTDAALAEDHLAVALFDDVLGGHQPLFDRGRQAALEQHRLVGASDLGEELEVLHVAGADLHDVGVARAGPRGRAGREAR